MDVKASREIRFHQRHLQLLPNAYSSLSSNRLTLLYFCVTAIDLAGGIESLDKEAIKRWVLAQQITSDNADVKRCGFRPSPHAGAGHHYDEAHIAMTYTALAVLKTIGVEYDLLDRKAIVEALKSLRRPDGSFSPVFHSNETDTRFVFCACAISHLLDDWSGVDIEKSTEMLLQCQTYEGGFGLSPGLEAHGGSTYCSLAALKLMGSLERLSPWRRQRLERWCLQRQGSGFSGRPNKPPDSCYSFWVGASLKLIGQFEFTNKESNRAFNLSCGGRTGGFGKVAGAPPDLLHSYCSLAGLSLMQLDELEALCPELGLSQRALAAQSQSASSME